MQMNLHDNRFITEGLNSPNFFSTSAFRLHCIIKNSIFFRLIGTLIRHDLLLYLEWLNGKEKTPRWRKGI